MTSQPFQPENPFAKQKFLSPAGSAPSASSQSDSSALNDELNLVENSCTTRPDTCVGEFIRIWKEHGGRTSRPIVLACIYAHGQSALAVLDAVSRAIRAAKTDNTNHYAMSFLQEAARILSSKIVDKKPLYELALAAGCWQSIVALDGPAKDKEPYVLQGLRETDTLHCIPDGLWSVSSAITEKSLPEIKTIMRRNPPDKERFWIAARTLVDYDDQEIVPELNRMTHSETLSDKQREAAKLFAIKLEFQHSQDKLLTVVKKERESRDLLIWAVRRLLWLKTPRSAIHAALLGNPVKSPTREDVAAAVDQYLTLCEGAEPPLASGSNVNLSMLDRSERDRYSDALKQQGLRSVMKTYSFHGLVSSAPAGN